MKCPYCELNSVENGICAGCGAQSEEAVMSAKPTPTPWHPSTYTTTPTFRAIEEHEALCREDGTLLALFGPKGHSQSIADRDFVSRAVIRASKSPGRYFAKKFGVAETTVSRIRLGKNWKEI